ncbi:MAG TPA: hypothetical protein QGG18_10610, partial [Rhodospirillales bacterium]|nr:hypothetical protein [Rhodospirillales bacterium]
TCNDDLGHGNILLKITSQPDWTGFGYQLNPAFAILYIEGVQNYSKARILQRTIFFGILLKIEALSRKNIIKLVG